MRKTLKAYLELDGVPGEVYSLYPIKGRDGDIRDVICQSYTHTAVIRRQTGKGVIARGDVEALRKAGRMFSVNNSPMQAIKFALGLYVSGGDGLTS